MKNMFSKSIFMSTVLSLAIHSIVIAALVGGVGFFAGTSEEGGWGLGVGDSKKMPEYIQISSVSVETSIKEINKKEKNDISINKVVKNIEMEDKLTTKRVEPSQEAHLRELGSSGSIGDGSGVEGEVTILSLYVKEVKKLIAEKSFYPQSAKRRGLEGTVNVSFSVSSDGVLYDVAISKPSGFNLLDDNALSIVKSVSPLPAPPRGDLRLELPLVFSIKTIW